MHVKHESATAKQALVEATRLALRLEMAALLRRISLLPVPPRSASRKLPKNEPAGEIREKFFSVPLYLRDGPISGTLIKGEVLIDFDQTGGIDLPEPESRGGGIRCFEFPHETRLENFFGSFPPRVKMA